MEKFESQLEEKTDYELIEIYSNAPDYQPEFIEQVKAHIVKRKIPLNTLSSLSEEEIKQLKTKPADGIAPTDKFDVRFLINPILFCIFLFATFSLVMFAFGLIISGHEDYLALGDSTLGQVSLVLSIIISFIIIKRVNRSKLWSRFFY